MCFIIDKKNCPHKLIAKHDIKCWKILKYHPFDQKYSSPNFTSHIWELNKTYKSNIKTYNKINILHIKNGLHSFMNRKEAIIIRYQLKILGMDYKKYKIFKAIIPKGSAYYFNMHLNEYVSTRLKIVKE